MDRKEGANRSALPLDAPALAPGDIVDGKYRIDAVVGRGGMSIVYRATHVHLEQLVALKVLSSAALVLPEYVTRLRREARAVSRIRSEHVVRICDIGELGDRGVPYLVMEYLSGADLAAILTREGRMPVDLAVDCVLQSCAALAGAHANGIVHRDLKPANLFLAETADGLPCVKVLDFGISRSVQRAGLSPLTDPGTVLGTPSYMAPEQMEAADTVDARSDVWALGTIFYELLVGRPPYTGESLPQIFMKIMRSRTPRPSLARPELPDGVDAIVARCLAVDPARRFQSVAELAWALAALDPARLREQASRVDRILARSGGPTGGRESARARARAPELEARGRRGRLAWASVSGVLVAAALAFGVFAAGASPAPAPRDPVPAVQDSSPSIAFTVPPREAVAPEGTDRQPELPDEE